MMTPTHLLMGAAAFMLPAQTSNDRVRNAAVLAGALAPDFMIFVLFGWSKIVGIDEETLWREVYWQDGWQTVFIIGNSALLYGVLAVIGAITHRRWLIVFALAALLHIGVDFLTHASDAHVHFWPVSDWRFHSPISYYEQAHHGGIVQVVEFMLGAVLSYVLWRRFHDWRARCVIGASISLYVLVPLYFTLMLG